MLESMQLYPFVLLPCRYIILFHLFFMRVIWANTGSTFKVKFEFISGISQWIIVLHAFDYIKVLKEQVSEGFARVVEIECSFFKISSSQFSLFCTFTQINNVFINLQNALILNFLDIRYGQTILWINCDWEIVIFLNNKLFNISFWSLFWSQQDSYESQGHCHLV